MAHRHRLVLALGVILTGLMVTVVFAVHAMAMPMVFTHRATFNTAGGSTTLTTFDTPLRLMGLPLQSRQFRDSLVVIFT